MAFIPYTIYCRNMIFEGKVQLADEIIPKLHGAWKAYILYVSMRFGN